MSTPKTSTYTITTTDGRTHDGTYETSSEAEAALAAVMGWDEVVLSDSYAVAEDVDACSAYPSEAERDDEDIAMAPYAPRIVQTWIRG